LVRDSGKSIGVVARELNLTESAVRAWVRQAGIDAGHGPAGALTTEEREELGRLRREIRTRGEHALSRRVNVLGRCYLTGGFSGVDDWPVLGVHRG